ncbi:MAG: GNAT family N-acetyltransferase [Stellaceae bacterium]
MRFGLLRLSAQHRISELVRPNPGIAFAALDAAGTILGILSLGFQGGDIAEIAVTVRSDCKRRGIGRALLEYGIEWAERHGLTQLIGYVLAENRAMLALAHRMGFQAVLADPYHLELRRSVPRDETLRIRHSGWSCGAGRSSASDPGLS